MPKDLPQDVPGGFTPEPTPPDAGGKPGGPTRQQVYTRKGGPTETEVVQQQWNRVEDQVRSFLRTPRRLMGTGPDGEPTYSARTVFHPEYEEPFADTSDQMVTALTNQYMTEAVSDEMLVKSEILKDIYSRESEHIIALAPETFLYFGDELSYRGIHTVGESLRWLSESLGGDYVAPWLESFLIPDGPGAEKTRAILQQIAGAEIDFSSVGGSNLSTVSATAQDLLDSILAGEKSFGQLTPEEQQVVQHLATQIYSAGEQILRGNETDIARAMHVYSSGKYGLVLNQEQQGLLTELVRSGLPAVPGGGTIGVADQPGMDQLGIEQLRGIEGGVIVLDEQWVEANPDMYAGVAAFLEQLYPDVQIQVGPEGIIGTALNAIGEPADFVGSGVGAALRQASEFAEQFGTSPELREKQRLQAMHLRHQIATGQVPEDQIDDVMHDIANLEEDATSTLGFEGFRDDFERSVRNRVQGGGFGELMAESLGIMPGDSGYSISAAAFTVAGQIAFDPTTYVLPMIRGYTLAGRLPLAALDDVADVGTVATALRSSPEFMADLALSARTEAQLDQAVARAAQAIVDNAQNIRRAGGIPDAVHGILTRRVYRALAKTPEQFVGTKPYRQAIEALAHWRKAVGVETFQANLVRGGMGIQQARRLAQAETLEDMWLAGGSQLLGLGGNTPNAAKIMAEAQDIERQLEAGRALPRALVGGPGVQVERLPVQPGDSIDRLFHRWHGQVDADVLAEVAPRSPNFLYHATDEANLDRVLREGLLPTAGRRGRREVYFAEDGQDIYSLRPARPRANDILLRVNRRAVPLEKTDLYQEGSDFAEWVSREAVPTDALEFYGSDGRWHKVAEIQGHPSSLAFGDTAEAAAFRAVETDLSARRQWLLSLLEPPDVTRVGVGLPPRRVMGRILKLQENSSSFDKAAYEAQGTSLNKFFFRMNHLYEQSGLGREVFIGTGAHDASIDHLQEFMRYMQIPEGRITELMGPLLRGELNSVDQQFDWWNTLWRSTIDESPTLNQAGKDALANWYTSHTTMGSADWLSRADGSPEATLAVNAPDGQVFGLPVNTAQEITGFTRKIPDARAMRQYQTMLGRTMTRYAAGSAGQKRISSVVAGTANLWHNFTNFWRTYVLAGRLAGALPARIWTEQQVRMAAYGYSSAFWHPSEYFRSTRAYINAGHDQFVLFADTPEAMLGSVVDDASMRLLRSSSAGLAERFQGARTSRRYFDAVSEVMRQWHSSPEFRYRLHAALADPDDWTTFDVARAEEMLRSPTLGHEEESARFLARFEDPNGTWGGVSGGLERTWESVRQLVGHGDDDVMDALRAMMLHGEGRIDDVTYRLGSNDLGEKLQELYKQGRWRPDAQWVATDAAHYLPDMRERNLELATNALFRWTYSKPDLALSRSPLYRQIAQREFNTLQAYGYSADKAYEVSKQRAARQTADMMFEIGMHTPGEAFWRNLNPFFPAWRELFSTWLIRIPQRLGGAANPMLSWAVGMTALTRRVQAGLNGLLAGGIIEKNPNGDWVIHAGSGEITLRSMFGIFPFPIDIGNDELAWTERLQGIYPTLGAPATAALAAFKGIAEKAGLDDVESFIDAVAEVGAPYGMDVSLGPSTIDAVWEAFADSPAPWMTGTTRSLHDTMKRSAIIDGMRIWAQDHPRPMPPDREGMTDQDIADWTRDVLTPWMGQMITAGKEYAQALYLRKGIMGMVLPFTWTPVDEGKRATEQLWADLSLIRGMPDLGGVYGKVVADFVDADPDLEAYLVGKYIDEREELQATEDLDTFWEALRGGQIHIRTPEEWAQFMYGKASMDFLRRRITQEEQNLRARFGREGMAAFLLDPNATANLERAQAELDNFVAWTSTPESRVPGQDVPFQATYEGYLADKRDRTGVADDLLTQREQELMDINTAISRYDEIITLDPAGSDNFHKTLDKAFAKLPHDSDDWWDQTISYFYGEVVGGYFDKTGDLYDVAAGADAVAKSAAYDQIRAISAEFSDRRVFRGVELPTPEEYQFSRWTPEQQKQHVAHWAALPAVYLTEFQREQVGYDIPEAKQDDANALANWASKVQRSFDKYFNASEGRNPSSDDYDTRDRYIRERAEELGLGEYWAQLTAPKYVRVGEALGLNDDAGWRYVSRLADSARSYLDGRELAPSGGSELARIVYNQFTDLVESARRQYKGLDATLNTIQASEELGPNDVVRWLFFDYLTDSHDFDLTYQKVA